MPFYAYVVVKTPNGVSSRCFFEEDGTELFRKQSDRPARTPRVVLAVASHDSLIVFDLTNVFFRPLANALDLFTVQALNMLSVC